MWILLPVPDLVFSLQEQHHAAHCGAVKAEDREDMQLSRSGTHTHLGESRGRANVEHHANASWTRKKTYYKHTFLSVTTAVGSQTSTCNKPKNGISSCVNDLVKKQNNCNWRRNIFFLFYLFFCLAYAPCILTSLSCWLNRIMVICIADSYVLY